MAGQFRWQHCARTISAKLHRYRVLLPPGRGLLCREICPLYPESPLPFGQPVLDRCVNRAWPTLDTNRESWKTPTKMSFLFQTRCTHEIEKSNTSSTYTDTRYPQILEIQPFPRRKGEKKTAKTSVASPSSHFTAFCVRTDINRETTQPRCFLAPEWSTIFPKHIVLFVSSDLLVISQIRALKVIKFQRILIFALKFNHRYEGYELLLFKTSLQFFNRFF